MDHTEQDGATMESLRTLPTVLREIAKNTDVYKEDKSRSRDDRMEAVAVGAIAKQLLAGHIPPSWCRFTDTPGDLH